MNEIYRIKFDVRGRDDNYAVYLSFNQAQTTIPVPFESTPLRITKFVKTPDNAMKLLADTLLALQEKW